MLSQINTAKTVVGVKPFVNQLLTLRNVIVQPRM
jgi:hypothetical protein